MKCDGEVCSEHSGLVTATIWNTKLMGFGLAVLLGVTVYFNYELNKRFTDVRSDISQIKIALAGISKDSSFRSSLTDSQVGTLCAVEALSENE